MITMDLNVDGLNRGIAESRKYSKLALPDLVNKAAYFSAVQAQRTTHYVTTEKIDSELSVVVSDVIGVRGKALKRKRKYSVLSIVEHNGKTVPLAALIIHKNVKPGALLANNPSFPLSQSPFKGFSRELGRQKMSYYVDRFIKSRHASTHLVAAGWTRSIKLLQELIGGSKGALNIGGDKLGYAVPATPGLEVTCKIANDVGGDASDENAESKNKALMTHGEPALQQALNDEGERQMNYAFKKLNEELRQTTAKYWG